MTFVCHHCNGLLHGAEKSLNGKPCECSHVETTASDQASINKYQDIFPFRYVGGGYFRRNDVPKGVKADTLHAMQAIDYVIDQMKHYQDAVEIVKRLAEFANSHPQFQEVLLTKEEDLKNILGDAVWVNKKLFQNDEVVHFNTV